LIKYLDGIADWSDETKSSDPDTDPSFT